MAPCVGFGVEVPRVAVGVGQRWSRCISPFAPLRRDVILTVCSVYNGVGVVYKLRVEFAVFSV